jgi:hypothetical protein
MDNIQTNSLKKVYNSYSFKQCISGMAEQIVTKHGYSKGKGFPPQA